MGHQACLAGDFDQVGAMKGLGSFGSWPARRRWSSWQPPERRPRRRACWPRTSSASIGIIPKERPKIDYRERAPLVLPSRDGAALRPLASREVESKAANWPKDPDVTTARKEAADNASPSGRREVERLSEGYRLSIDEMRAGRRTGGSRSTQTFYTDNRADKSRLSPDELKLPQEAEAKLDRQQARAPLALRSAAIAPERGRRCAAQGFGRSAGCAQSRQSRRLPAPATATLSPGAARLRPGLRIVSHRRGALPRLRALRNGLCARTAIRESS